MLFTVIIAGLLMLVTTAVHTVGMVLVIKVVRFERWHHLPRIEWKHIFWFSSVIVLMFLVMVIEALVWAAAFLSLGAMQGLEQAVYFSMVTYTTLGYGDIVLDENWRLLASFEAANGIIMFGWTTAIITAAVKRLWPSHAKVHIQSTREGA